jgi:hypothetical protein
VRNLAPSSRPPAATYWRRRFIVLATGLAALALVTWAMSSALGGTAPKANTDATKSLHRPRPSASAPSPAVTSPAVTPTTTDSPSHSAASTPKASVKSHPASQPTGLAVPASAHSCPANAVVLTLFPSQASYSVTEQPEFSIDVVSTASKTCTFNIGSRHLWLEVKKGRQQVWSSSQCAEGDASMVTILRRGVPTIVTIVWDGHVSSPGCPVPGAATSAGNYTAVASDGVYPSNVVTFHKSG